MPQDKIKEVYDLISDLGYFADENEFRGYVSDPNRRKEAYELISDAGYFSDENEFNSYFEPEKKKFGVEDFNKKYGTSYTPQEFGGQKPSQLKSPSTSTPTSTTTTTPKTKKVAELPKYDPTSRIKLYTETSQRIQQRIPQLVEAFNVAEQSGDVEEAARLQELINVDSERLNIFEQGIKMQKDLAKKNEASSLAIGLDNVMGGLMAGVNFLEEAQQNIFADLTGIRLSEETLKGINEVNKKIGTIRPSDALAKAGKEILEKSKIKTEEKTMNMPYQGGVWEALKKGDIKAASSNAGTHFLMSMPQSVLMANPITGSLLSAGMAQQSVDEERAAGNNVTSSDYMVGAAKAATEYVFENMFGTGKALKEMVQALGNDAARIAIERTTKAGLKEWAKKVGVNITEEFFGEGLTQISQNIIDIANGKKVGVLDGVPDAALIGLFGGMTQGTATTTITHYVDRAKLKEYEVKKEKAIQLQEQALEAPSEVVAEAIEVQAAKINEEADAIAEENNEIGANADPEIIAELEQENADLDELEAALPEAPPEVQEAIQAQIEEKTKVVEALTKEARVSALERLKIAEEEIKPKPQENEEATITTQEENVEPMLGRVQTDRGEVKVGEAGTELRTNQEGETQEVKPTETKEEVAPQELSVEAKKAALEKELEALNEENLLSIINKIKFKDGNTVKDLMPNFSVDDANVLAETGFKDVLTKEELDAVEKYRTRKIRIKAINAKLDALKTPQVEVQKPILAEEAVSESKNESKSKAKDSSGDIGSRADDSRTKKSDIAADTDTEQSDKKVDSTEETVSESKEEVAPQEVSVGVGKITPTLKLDGLNNSVLNNISQDNRDAVNFLKSYPENFVGITDIGGGAEKITGITNKGGAKIEKITGFSIQLNFKNDRTKVLHFTTEEAKNKAVDKIYEYISGKELGKYELGQKESPSVQAEEAVSESKENLALKDVESTAKSLYLERNKDFPIQKVNYKNIDSDLGISYIPRVGYKIDRNKLNETLSDFGFQIVTRGNKFIVSFKDTFMADGGVDFISNSFIGEQDLGKNLSTFLSGVIESLPRRIKEEAKFKSEAYHKAKQDGSNPELVKAVEELLTNKQQEDATKSGKIEQSNLGERKGVTEQQQGKQEDRVNQEEPITEGQTEAGGGDSVIEGGQEQGLIKNDKQSNDILFEKPYTQDSKYEKILDTLEKYFKKDKGLFLIAYDKIVKPSRQTRKGFAYEFYDKGKIIELEKTLSEFYKSDFDKSIGGFLNFKELNEEGGSKQEVTPAEVVPLKESPKNKVREKVVKIVENKSGKSISQWKKESLALVDKVINAIIDNETSDPNVKQSFLDGLLNLPVSEAKDILEPLGVKVTDKLQIIIPTPQGEIKANISTLVGFRKQIASLSDSSVVSNENTRLPSRSRKVDAQVAATEFYEPESQEDADFELSSAKESLDNAKKNGNKKLIELAQVQYDFYKDWSDNFDRNTEFKARMLAEAQKRKEYQEKQKDIESKSKELNALINKDLAVFREAGIDNQEDLYDFLEALGIKEIPTKMTKDLYANLFAKAALDRNKHTFLAYAASIKDRKRDVPKVTSRSSTKKFWQARDIENQNKEVDKLLELANKYEDEATKIFKELTEGKGEDRTIRFLDSLKIRAKGRAFGILPPFAIPIGVWNAAIDSIILGVKAGRVISEVVQEAIKYINDNHGKFDEKAFKDMLIEGGVVTEEELVGGPQPETKGESEPIVEEEPQPEPKKEKEKAKGGATRVSKFFDTLQSSKPLSAIARRLDEADFEYNVKSMELDRAAAVAYIEEHGLEQTFNDIVDNTYAEGSNLTESEKIAMAALVQGSISKAIELAELDANTELADEYFRLAGRLNEKIKTMGTEYGRAINEFKSFYLDFSNPITAVFNAQKMQEAVNRKVVEDEANQKNAKKDAETVTKTVESGKRKTAEKVAQEVDTMIHGVITKGQKGLTTEQKAKVKNIFNSFKVDPNARALSKVAPIKEIVAGLITPKLYNEFIDKVGDISVEGISLAVAMTRVSTEFIKNKIATPKEMAAARKALSEQVNGLKEKRTPTQAQLDKKAASEELKAATEKFNAEKEIADYKEKQNKKAQTLREKDAKKVLEEVEKLELQRAQQEAKEAAELEEELRKDRKRIADLKAKEETDRQDRVAKLELQRAQEKLKQTEKAIKDLVSDITKNNEELVTEIINEYMAMEPTDKTNNQKLIDMVKEKLGLNDAQAKTIATSIQKGIVDNVRKKLVNRYGKQVEKSGKKKAEPKTTDQYIDEMVREASMGELVSEAMMTKYFSEKYGVDDFTKQDAENVRAIAKEIANASTPERKAEKIAKMRDYLAAKNPAVFAELIDEMWYFARLSSVLTFGLGTADVNNTYNLLTLQANAAELPIVAVLQGIRQRNKDKTKITLREVGNQIFQTIILSFTNAMVQRLQLSPKDNQAKDNFLRAIKGKNLLNESFTYYQEVLTNGMAAFTEVEKPFENIKQGEFDINKYFDLARKGDKNARAIIGNMVSSIVNSAYRGVPRVLGGSDLFFGSIVKNAYVPIILKEKLYKEGFRGEELMQKVMEAIIMDAAQVEDAENKAAEMREKQDIAYEMKMEGNTPYWIITDKGKPVKEGKVVKNIKKFSTKEDAIEYAQEEVIRKGTQFKRDVSFILNENIGREVIKSAARVAQRDLLSGKTEGFTSVVDKKLDFINNTAREMTAFFDKAAKNRNSVEWNAVYEMFKDKEIKGGAIAATNKFISGTLKGLAILSKSIGRLVAFKRVALNLVRKSSNYFGLGYFRYAMATRYNKSAFGQDYATELTQAEKDKYLAEAVIGTISLLLLTNVYAQIKDLFRGDDDDEEGKKALIAKQFKAKTGEKAPPELVNFVYNLREGDVIGSLDFLPPNERRYYNRTGVIQENSKFMGIDKNGNYKFKSLLGNPIYGGALALATYTNYWELKEKEKQKSGEAIGSAIMQPLTTFYELSIGQGIGKFLSSKQEGEKYKAFAQTLILDNLELMNPDIIKKPLQYVDAKLRPTQTLFDFLDEAENPVTGVSQYAINKITPVYGAIYSATKAPQAYGMYGEELYRLPAEGQGMLTQAIKSYLYGNKNLEEKAMYDWQAANGYKNVWVAPKEIPIVTPDLEVKKLSEKKINEYGIAAGQKSFREISQRMAELQDIRLNEGEKVFEREISAIMGRNFVNYYLEGEGLITKEDAANKDKLIQQEITAKKAERIQDREIKARFQTYLKDQDVTEEEYKLMEFTKENKRKKADIMVQYIRKQGITDTYDQQLFLRRMSRLGIISADNYNEISKILGIVPIK